MTSATFLYPCFMLAFAVACFARSIPARNYERILVTVDYEGPHTHPSPPPHLEDHFKLFPDYNDPHTHPTPPGPPHADVLGNYERILATVDYGGPHTHPSPPPHSEDHSKLFPDYGDPHTHPSPPGPPHADILENYEKILATVDYGGPHTHPSPPPHPEDHSKVFSDYGDPHTHPSPPGPPHVDVSGNYERILATVDYGGPHTHPSPPPQPKDHSKLFPDYGDPHTHPTPPGPPHPTKKYLV